MTTLTQVRERPIIFDAESVRRILDGRQTQTRRVVKPQPSEDCGRIIVEEFHPTVVDRYGDEQPGDPIFGAYSEDGEWGLRCPYGQPGDRLWVRETWAWCRKSGGHYLYVADGDGFSTCHVDGYRWRPSIHMPRAASRLTLEISDVRVERVQEITETDAQAEGIADGGCLSCGQSSHPVPCGCGDPRADYRDAFAHLWDSFNASRGYGWQANPWVWVLTFQRVDGAA